MGRIREWFRRHQLEVLADEEKLAEIDRALAADRVEAETVRHDAENQIAEVRRLKPRSATVNRGMKALREDNHFGTWLFPQRYFREGPQ